MFNNLIQKIQNRFAPKILKPIPEREYQDNNNSALDFYYQQNRQKEDFYKKQQQLKPQPTQTSRSVVQPQPTKVIAKPQQPVKKTVAYVPPTAQINPQQAFQSGGLRASNSAVQARPTSRPTVTPTPSPNPTITPPPDQAAAPYAQLINEVSKRNNIPDHILYNLIKKESNFNPNAQSGAGAQGIAQVVPKWHPKLKDPFNPQEAIQYAGKHLRESFDRFGSWDNALAAYNAGGPAVGQYGGIPPFPETQNYVQKIMQWAEEDRKRYKKKR
jgi:soluble lytic murein transglycosylase-like protein